MVRCDLSTVAEVVAQHDIQPPTLFVVGKVTDRAPDVSWFAARPLLGKRILVTGSPSTSVKLRDQFTALGAAVVRQPAIKITEPADWSAVDASLDKLGSYDWLVFSSGNGIDYFFRRLLQRGGDCRLLGGVKLAVIGSETAAKLAEYHLQADLVPERFNAESLAEALSTDAHGKRFLLAMADRGRPVLEDALREAGGLVERIAVYSSQDVDTADAEVAAALSADQIDWITVTSSATARSLVRQYGDDLHRARLASISPLTSAALRDLGHEPSAEASAHTIPGVVAAVVATLLR
jgi:uroporphyrinogen III methyltransferase/synthase